MGNSQSHIEPEVVPWDVAEVLRGRSPAEKFEMICGLWRFARRLCEAGVRMQHPDWDASAVHQEVARRLAVGSD